jgi:hypothetical protein
MAEDKRSLTAIKQSVYYRNWRRARDRALVRLAQKHKDEFRIMMEEERRKDEESGKTWSTSGLTIIPPLGTRDRVGRFAKGKSSEAISDGESESNV